MIIGLWVETFLFLAEIFQGVVNGAFYVSGGEISSQNYFFLKITNKIFSSEFGQKILSFSNQKVSWMILKTAWLLFRLTLWMKWFCLENVNFRSFLD